MAKRRAAEAPAARSRAPKPPLAPPPPAPSPPPPEGRTTDVWDDRVADVLAFLRRRLTGQYEVDEFGFDPDLTDNAACIRCCA